MSFEISGRLAEKFATQQISERFQKREFFLEIKSSGNSGFEFVDCIKFQATQDKCPLLDQVDIDDMVKVSFNLRGRKWEKDGQVSYFTNLDAWRIEKSQPDTGEQNIQPPIQSATPDNEVPFPNQPPNDNPDIDDLPF